jgi:hypothetical protein
MRCGRISDGEKLFRHSVRPNGFKRDAFSPLGLLKLFDQQDGSVLGSVTWEHFFPTTDYVHGYGCRLAAKGNRRLELDSKFNAKSRRVYCGAYQLTARAVRALASIQELEEIESADVSHHPEDGEIAHTDLRIRFKRIPADIEGTKTAIIDRLWAASYGPLRNICAYDLDLNPHPNLSLIDGPSGPYIDKRHPFLRLWRVLRLKLCKLCNRRSLTHPA